MNTEAKNGNNRKKIRISPLHLLAFLSAYLVNLLLFSAFRSYFFLITAVLFTVLVPFSFFVAWHLADCVSIHILLTAETIRQKEETEVAFCVTNKSWLCALRATWLLSIGNTFYQTYDSHKLVLSVPPHGKKQYQMTITPTDLGRVGFSCGQYFITDFLGIFSVYKDCMVENGFYVLPLSGDSPQEAVPEMYAGVAELSESRQKGSDYSEVSDIRTYMPGDRPRDIHWKLSARQTELMVKERVALSGSEHILVFDFPPDKVQAEKLLSEGYSKIKTLIESHMSIRLLVWNKHQFVFESHSCTCAEELDATFCKIFRTDLSSHSSSMLQQYMKNCYPQLESYLCMMTKNNSVTLEMCING